MKALLSRLLSLCASVRAPAQTNHFPNRRSASWLVACGVAFCWPVGALQAQDLESMTRSWLDQALHTVEASATGLPLRMEVELGELNSRLRLAPCARVEPYLPVGSKLWGRSRLGLRCVDGTTRWNVYLPITVNAYGPAWVLTRDVPTGTVLGPEHVTEAETNWAQQSVAVIADPEQWMGLVASRPLKAGQALRQNMVRAAYAFKSGTQVKVLASGAGYMVSGIGKAMAAGSVGQSVRVRMANGKMVTGTVTDDGSVLVPM